MSFFVRNERDAKGYLTEEVYHGRILAVTALAVISLVSIILFGMPRYRVWQQSLAGRAELSRAEYNRKIAITEAEAKRESSKALAQAEVERARGVAEANRIIGQSLAGNEAYLRYLWIQGLNDGSSEVIYIPTEANLPILEATRGLPPRPEAEQ